MDAIQFFLFRHARLHGALTDELLSGLTDAHLRGRPHPSVNTPAWLLWHMARIEDVAVSRFVAGRPQLFDAGGWSARLGAPRRDVGTSMTAEEVDELSAKVDLMALRAYWGAVGERTHDLVQRLSAADLDEVNQAAYAEQVLADEQFLAPAARWALGALIVATTRGQTLATLGLTHGYTHLGEARVARGLLGFPGH
ncbi:MAG: DinB family protein [Dehalococcoidia bacterium]